VSRARATALGAVLRGATAERRGCAHGRDRGSDRPLRLSARDGALAPRRLGGECQAGRADLAAGRAEGAAEAAQARAARLDDGDCLRLRPEWPHYVWSYDFVLTRTRDGRPLRLLEVLDEFTRRCLGIRVARWLDSDAVLELLAKLFGRYGVPAHL
jgi:putative transposase